MTKMWMVKSGKESVFIDDFIENNLVAIGWNVGDLTIKSPEEIKKLIKGKYGNKNKSSHITHQVKRFIFEIAVDDYVVTNNNHEKTYVLGKIVSPYIYSKKITKVDNYGENYWNVRDVEWLAEIPKNSLKKSTQSTLKASLSVFNIYDDARENILYLSSISGGEIEPPKLFPDLKRNLIYFGAPGTGKSFNLNKDKEKLLEGYENNYERVTFHPDYSYANFVGTYKPVPKGKGISYEYVPGPFMRVLANALKKPSQPFLLIIEEINRANVAAVFGEVFQLLDRNENKESVYSIDTSQDMKTYINQDKITIPRNMFIWATMNSADQGVFPIDTAFKRRWDFKYFSINNNEYLIEDIGVKINSIEVNWNVLRKAINNELLSYKINEDKLMGPFFAYNEFMGKKIDVETFKDIFKNKIIMYLFEDAARSRRNELFSGVAKGRNLTYSQICDEFDKNGIEIFTEAIVEKFIPNNDGE